MKKIFVLVMMTIFTITIAASAFAAPTVPGAVYSDTQAIGISKPAPKVAEDLAKAGVKDVKADYFAAGSITVLLESGLMKPDANGNFNPNAKLNSGSGVAVFAKVLGIASKTDSDEVALAKSQQAGLADPHLTVDRPLTRLQVAWLLGNALGIDRYAILDSDLSSYPFNDADEVSPEDRGLLAALYKHGVFKGYPDKTFRPGNILTRAEIAILIDRILGAAY